MHNFGLDKGTLYTDDADEEYLGLDETYRDIVNEIEMEEDEDLQEQLNFLSSDKSVSFKQWQDQEFLKDQEALNNLLKNKVTRRAYARQNHVEEESLNNEHSFTTLPNSVFYMMDTDENQDTRSNIQKEFDSIIDLR